MCRKGRGAVRAKKNYPYHHGQLRRALLDTALKLATSRGVHGFTLRELARQAGVSHAAPYHHFADKAALMAALALEIFEAFSAALRQAWDTAPGASIDRLMAVGAAYVRFALDNPAAFRLMFRPELWESTTTDDAESHAALEAAREAAFYVLLDGITACQEDGVIPPGDPQLIALTAWSTVHGLATLLLDGLAGEKRHGAWPQGAQEMLVDSVLERLRMGLMARTTPGGRASHSDLVNVRDARKIDGTTDAPARVD
jgi:AcrR family transcriptional regulator